MNTPTLSVSLPLSLTTASIRGPEQGHRGPVSSEVSALTHTQWQPLQVARRATVSAHT